MNIQAIKQTVGPQTLNTDQTGKRAYVTLQVFGAGVLYYGNSIAEITSSQNDPTQYRGFQVVAGDGIQRFWTNKPLVVVVSADLTLAYDVDYFDGITG